MRDHEPRQRLFSDLTNKGCILWGGYYKRGTMKLSIKRYGIEDRILIATMHHSRFTKLVPELFT